MSSALDAVAASIGAAGGDLVPASEAIATNPPIPCATCHGGDDVCQCGSERNCVGCLCGQTKAPCLHCQGTYRVECDSCDGLGDVSP
jgi:hypothetical protein